VSAAGQLSIEVDTDSCCSSGRCADTEPRVFDQSDEDGTVVLLMPTVGPELRESVLLCESLCPCGAISVTEQAGSG
jgi:ferredoxin